MTKIDLTVGQTFTHPAVGRCTITRVTPKSVWYRDDNGIRYVTGVAALRACLRVWN